MSDYTFNWYGSEIEARMDRAMARSAISFGVHVSVEAKRLAHVDTGTMRRSIHAAPADVDHSDDEKIAQGGSDIPDTMVPTWRPELAEVLVEVGSWVPYACVEEVGRNHQFVTPAVESVRGAKAQSIVFEALAQEFGR